MRTEVRRRWFSFLRRFLPSVYVCSLPLVLVLSMSFVCAQESVIELTNADVLAMVRDKLPAEAIITKIQTSLCHFDTFPTVISELRYKGVPEEVLIAMVEAPIGRTTKSIDSRLTPVKREQQSNDSTAKAATPKLNPESTSAALTSSKILMESKPVASVLPRKKVSVEPDASAGKAPATLVPEKRKTENVAGPEAVDSRSANTMVALPSVQKKNRETVSATLPLPEPVKLESAFAKPQTIVMESATPPASPGISAGPGAAEMSQHAPKQSAQGPYKLTNTDIIKFLRDGLAISVVVETIKTTPGNYDLSSKALLELRDAGADASIFLSMMEVNQKTGENKSTAPDTSAAVPAKKP